MTNDASGGPTKFGWDGPVPLPLKGGGLGRGPRTLRIRCPCRSRPPPPPSPFQGEGEDPSASPQSRLEEPAVYNMLSRADSIGVFQVESRAQMSMLPRLQPKAFLRPRHRGRDRAAGPDPGRHGASLSAAAAGRGKGGVSLARPRSRRGGRTAAGARQDARRAAVPGAGDAHRDRRRRLHAGRGRQAAPRHGDVPPGRHHPVFPRQARRGHGASRLSPRLRRALLPPDRRASANTAFPRAMPPASRSSSMPRRG